MLIAWLLCSNGPPKPPCKASRSRMASMRSRCPMVALGDTDPLEWRSLCPSFSSVPRLSPWSFVSTVSPMSPFQSLPVSNGVGALPLSHVRTGLRRHLQSRFYPTFLLYTLPRVPSSYPLPMAVDSLIKKPPALEWRRCPPAVVWSPWATLTLWSGTGSV